MCLISCITLLFYVLDSNKDFRWFYSLNVLFSKVLEQKGELQDIAKCGDSCHVVNLILRLW